MGASSEQMDFKIAYASAIKKVSGTDPDGIVDNYDAVFDLILDFSRPKVNASAPLQMQFNSVTYVDFKSPANMREEAGTLNYLNSDTGYLIGR